MSDQDVRSDLRANLRVVDGSSSPLPDTDKVLKKIDRLADDAPRKELESLLRDLRESVSNADCLSRELTREQAVKALKGKVSAPGRLVSAALMAPDPGTEADESAHDIEPWADEVPGEELLDGLLATVRAYVRCTTHQAVAIALWILHTYSIQWCVITPRLVVTSPVAR